MADRNNDAKANTEGREIGAGGKREKGGEKSQPLKLIHVISRSQNEAETPLLFLINFRQFLYDLISRHQVLLTF